MKKSVLTLGILLHFCSYKAQDTIQPRNLQQDLALINTNTPLKEPTPFSRRNG
ncbi:hypothetical protein [Chryseobacterium capnotolerans]|uniref:hypothetical protein n=1 Tax=Chryseobacterium capnotolerans TaxID=2759528 RepID=UPI001E5E0898|nr:hypothetical protein [Chryseobacterium capnotolerans]